MTLPANDADGDCENELLNLSIHICSHFICSFIKYLLSTYMTRGQTFFLRCTIQYGTPKRWCLYEGRSNEITINQFRDFKTWVNPIKQVHTAHDETLVVTLEKKGCMVRYYCPPTWMSIIERPDNYWWECEEIGTFLKRWCEWYFGKCFGGFTVDKQSYCSIQQFLEKIPKETKNLYPQKICIQLFITASIIIKA